MKIYFYKKFHAPFSQTCLFFKYPFFLNVPYSSDSSEEISGSSIMFLITSL